MKNTYNVYKFRATVYEIGWSVQNMTVYTILGGAYDIERCIRIRASVDELEHLHDK